MLKNRNDVNMQIPYHNLTWEKNHRMGSGAIAPLNTTLKNQMKLPSHLDKIAKTGAVNNRHEVIGAMVKTASNNPEPGIGTNKPAYYNVFDQGHRAKSNG